MNNIENNPYLFLKQVGDFIKNKRKERGWTQEDFSKVLGVSRPWIVSLEAGTNSGASIGNIIYVLNIFGENLALEGTQNKNPQQLFDEERYLKEVGV